jgi:hypothetical protein
MVSWYFGNVAFNAWFIMAHFVCTPPESGAKFMLPDSSSTIIMSTSRTSAKRFVCEQTWPDRIPLQ